MPDYIGFTDSEGHLIREINQQNMQDFMRFVEMSAYEAHDGRSPSMVFNGVDLNDLVGDYQYGLSEKAQMYLGQVIGTMNIRDPEALKKMAHDLLDHAEKNPVLLRMAFLCAGSFPTADPNGSLFHTILEEMKHRSLSQNLPALIALAPSGETYAPLGKVIENPTNKDIELFEKLYHLSQKNSTAEEKTAAGNYKEIFDRIASRGEFANSELSGDVRRAHNDAYFAGESYRDLTEPKLLGNIVTDEYGHKTIHAAEGVKIVVNGSQEDTKEQALMAEQNGQLFVRLDGNYIQDKDGHPLGAVTDDGKILQNMIWMSVEDKVLDTKTEFFGIEDLQRIGSREHYGKKNTDGKVSAFDLKAIEICWHLIEQTNPRDPNNPGHDKTYLQRFKDMVGWDDQKYLGDSSILPLMRDMYIHAAQRDVMEGRAADLDEKALGAVLANDKTGYYLTKIPQKVMDQYPNKFNLNDRQKAILRTRTPAYVAGKEDFDFLLKDDLTSAEKRKTLEDYETYVKESKIAYEADKKRAEKVQADRAKIDAYRTQKEEAEVAQDIIRQLRAAYADVKGKMKTADASDKDEKNLSEESLNRHLLDVLNGKDAHIEMPDYGHLPWFGKRKDDEEKRRSDLQGRLNKLNEIVEIAKLAAQNNPLILQYAGEYGLLSEQAEDSIKGELERRQNILDRAVDTFKYEHHVREVNEPTDGESYVQKIDRLRENIKGTKDQLEEKEKPIRKRAQAELVSRGWITAEFANRDR